MERAFQHGQGGVQATKKGTKEDGWWDGTGRALRYEMIVEFEVYDNMPGFSGITGGFESGEYRCDHYFTRGHTYCN